VLRDDRRSIKSRDVRILRAQNFVQNRPSCTEFGVLCRIDENLPNGSENAKILLIFAMWCYASVAYVVMWCLSACVSITFVNSVKKNKHIINILSSSGSHTILVFPWQTALQYSDGNHPNGGIECRWGRQKSRFWTYIWLYCLLLTLQQAGVVNTVASGPWPVATVA